MKHFLPSFCNDDHCVSKSCIKTLKVYILIYVHPFISSFSFSLFLSVPLAVVCSGVLGLVWVYCLDHPDPSVVPYYGIGVICFALSTLIEVLAEPLWVVGQAFLFVRLKVTTANPDLILYS